MQDWTNAETALHKEGQRLLQQARDQRKERLKREKDAAEKAALYAKQQAEKQAAAERVAYEQQIAKFIKLMADALRESDLQMAPYGANTADFTISTWDRYGQTPGIPLFQLVSREDKDAPYFTVRMKPGVGFQWS